MNEKMIIVVLGMHRSGTSVVARCMKVLGAETGDSLIPAQKDNPKGFYEDKDILELDEEMLGFLGSSWEATNIVSLQQIEELFESDFFIRACNLLEKKLQHYPIFVIKEPRMVVLLPFWRKVFVECSLNVKYVIAIRNPLSVASSLEKRNGMDPAFGVTLWFGYVLRSLQETVEDERVLVDYDRILLYPKKEVQRLSEMLGLPFSSHELDIFVKDFLDKNLQHSAFGLNAVRESDILPKVVGDFYGDLMKIASDTLPANSPEFITKIRRLVVEHSAMYPVWRLLDVFRRERYEQLRRIDSSNKQRRIYLSELNKLQSYNANLKNLLEAEKGKVALYENSFSWKITSPFRKIARLVRKISMS